MVKSAAPWHLIPVRVGSVRVTVATKPGVSAHGATDPAAEMLAEAVVRCAPSGGSAPQQSLHLASGNGLVPAVALQVGYRISACDRSFPNAEATRRALMATLSAAQAESHTPAEAVPRVLHAVIPDWEGPHAPEAHPVALATVRIPTDRVSAQLMVVGALERLRPGGTLLMAGGNAEGIKSLASWVTAAVGPVRLDAQHSGHRCLAVVRPEILPAAVLALPWQSPDAWREVPVTLGGESFVCCTRPGVFSWEHLDEAAAVLGDTLGQHPVPVGARVLDLGSGSGPLGILAARQSRSGRVLLVDADAEAVRSARATAERAGCTNVEVRASDVATAIGDESFDVVITNPPFHVGKATDLDVPRAFIDASHAVGPSQK